MIDSRLEMAEERFRTLLLKWLAKLSPDGWEGTSHQLGDELAAFGERHRLYAYVPICPGRKVADLTGFWGSRSRTRLRGSGSKCWLRSISKSPERKNGKWYPAVPPLCRGSAGIGPTDYFGRTLVAHPPKDIKVGVVNVSVAGCKIELFDKDNYEAYSKTATRRALPPVRYPCR